ncbi:MAG: MMPL family transporter, partial [Solirubrobacterales bacterium]|nr:MMPL family transporter [Solirubrobacterales bacterium]
MTLKVPPGSLSVGDAQAIIDRAQPAKAAGLQVETGGRPPLRGLSAGLDLRESIARASATSGGAVFFAGGTVTIALVWLAVAGVPLVTTMDTSPAPHPQRSLNPCPPARSTGRISDHARLSSATHSCCRK